jgi:hypothetical protein
MALLMVTPDNEEVNVEERDFDAALKSGLQPALEYVDRDGVVNVVKKSDQRAAEKAGLKLRVLAEGRQDADKMTYQPGKTESALRGFANAATFGFSDEIAGAGESLLKAAQKGSVADVKGDYRKGRDRYRTEDDAAYERNTAAYGLGAVAPTVATLGAAAPALTVGKAALQGAGLGALASAGGGTDASGQADLTRGETGDFARQVGTGAALGGALGGALQKGARALERSPESLKTFANQRAVKAAGGDSAKATRVVDRMPGGVDALGRDLLETGIVSAGKSPTQIAETAARVERDAGRRIGETLERFDDLARTKGYTPQSLQRVLERSEEEVLKPLNASPATQELGERLVSKYIGRLKSFVEGKAKEGNALSFKDLAKERRLLDKTAFTESGLDKPLNERLQQIRRIFNEELLNDAQAVAPQSLLDDYARQNRLFGVARTAKDLTTEQLKRSQKNRSVSLTDYITGGAGAAAGGAALGPYGLVLGPLVAGVNKAGRQRGNQVMAAGADRASQLMQTLDPAKLRTYLDALRRGLVQKGTE